MFQGELTTTGAYMINSYYSILLWEIANALSDHENICWVSEQSLDEAKPSEPRDEAEQPEITVGAHGDGKKAVKAQPLKDKNQ